MKPKHTGQIPPESGPEEDIFSFTEDTKPQEAENRNTEPPEKDLQLDRTETDADFRTGVFLNSLEELRADDIEMNEAAAAAAKTPVSEWIRRILFVFFMGTFLVSSWMLVDNLLDKHRSEAIYDRLEQEFMASGFSFDAAAAQAFRPEEGAVKYLRSDTRLAATPSMDALMSGAKIENPLVPAEHREYNEELEKMRAGLASLSRINEDLYGWISVDGTTINYPVVQGDDNAYYLNHAYTGDFLPNGSIFADYRNHTSITKNYNTVLYGHNITSGAMFHDVTKFFEDDYFEHVTINICTDDGIFVYEPFSVYETRFDYNYFRTSFASAEEFIAFAEEVRDNSTMKSKADMTFTENDRILTLSTCTNGAYYARYALHAKLVKTILD